MIPIRDSEPSGITPYVTIGILVLNVLVSIAQYADPGMLLMEGGLRPAWFIGYLNGETMGTIPEVERKDAQALEVLFDGRFAPPTEMPLTFATAILPLFLSMFLHGGLMHLIGNMLFLWIFSDNIEGRLGHVRFLIFYLLCGVIASLTHVVLNPVSITPTVGASGAIAGILGAYWLCYPHSKVTMLFWIYVIIRTFEIRASWFLGFWFARDIFRVWVGLEGSTAVWAHIGGFVIGTCLIIPFTPPGHSNREVRFRWLERSGLIRK